MARFDEKSGNLYVTELGRVASHFYIRHSSIVIYNDLLKRHMSEAEVRQHLCIQSANLNLHQGRVCKTCLSPVCKLVQYYTFSAKAVSNVRGCACTSYVYTVISRTYAM